MLLRRSHMSPMKQMIQEVTEVRAGQSIAWALSAGRASFRGQRSQEPVQAGAVSVSSAPIHSHSSLPVALMRAVVSCWGLAVQRGRPVQLGDSGFSLSQADRVHVGGLQDSLGGNQAGRLQPWRGF